MSGLTSYRNSTEMAHCLVGYIACDQAVWSAIHSEFDTAIGLPTIREIRRQRRRAEALHRRGKQAKGYNAMNFDWRGDKYRADMESASATFVKMIERERRP